MSKDQVCGMDVDESTARAAGRMSKYQGAPYFFDSDICKLVFAGDDRNMPGSTPQPKK